jgi:hypothetical protein
MAFTLHTPDGDEHFPDGTAWRIESHGLLVIVMSDRRQFIYSPAGWHYIEEDKGTAASPTALG